MKLSELIINIIDNSEEDIKYMLLQWISESLGADLQALYESYVDENLVREYTEDKIKEHEEKIFNQD